MTGDVKHKLADVCGVAARWIVGALFVYMGLKKALDPVHFLKLIRQYDLTQNPFLLNAVAAALPWFEAFSGILLLTGVAVRGTALAVVAMLVPFTALVLRRALALQSLHSLPFCAVKFDCGCGAGEVYICGKLAENAFLIFSACWLLAGVGRAFALRYELWRPRAIPPP
jgi:uncharacterized membrane protein YphA (DoxX/SURF4 family)